MKMMNQNSSSTRQATSEGMHKFQYHTGLLNKMLVFMPRQNELCNLVKNILFSKPHENNL